MGARARAVLGIATGIALLAFAASAGATVRYAAPGGTAAVDGCGNPAPGSPRCSIYTAAQGAGVGSGDEVVIEPGDYSDTAGDLGPSGAVEPAAHNVHGAAGEPRPVITLNESGSPAFELTGTLAHLEIDSIARGLPIYMTNAPQRGEDLIVRSSVASNTACYVFGGVLSDSACLETGAGGRALGADGGGTVTPTIRNVTAISSGTGATTGMWWSSPAASTTVSVKSSIASAPKDST